MAKVNVTLSLSSTDLFAKQTLSFTETDSLTPVGDQQIVGKICCLDDFRSWRISIPTYFRYGRH